MIEIDSKRLESVLSVLAEAVLGNYQVRLSRLEESRDDAFLELEVASNMLLDELQSVRQRNDEQNQELQRRSEMISQQQAELVRALSTPIIVVAKGVLALPIIGTVEAERAQRMIEAVLERVVIERASWVVLDLTAAGDIAPATAASLLRMVQAVKLLGARCIITGISPTMARTLVSLHFQGAHVVTLPLLADALELVLKQRAMPGPGPGPGLGP
jgi:rsbT co-antagonist protein RsbR